MPITPFLNGEKFDLETRRVLGIAFELTCIALRIGDCDDDVKQAIADTIIAVAKTGERNPDVLCEKTLRDIRGSGGNDKIQSEAALGELNGPPPT